jgi:DHA1 family bicyclomycin/chloramphenicol resistance-like MFS transporter
MVVTTTTSARIGPGWFLVMLGSLMMLPPLSIDISLPGLPRIAHALHATPALLQWTLSAFVLAFGLGQLVLGPLSDRIGRRPVLLGGLFVFTLAGAGCAFATDARVLVALRLLGGIGACAGTVCARAIAQDLSTDRAGATFRQAVLQAVNSFAPIVAPLLGALILAVLQWRWLYGLLAIVGAVLFAIVAFFLTETGQRSSGELAVAYARVLRLPRTGGLALVIAGSFFGYFSMITTAPFALIEQLHITTTQFALAFAVNACAFLFGATVTGRLARSVDPEILMATGVSVVLVAGACAFALDRYAPTVPGVIAAWALYAVGVALALPGSFAAALGAARHDAGLAAGLLGAGQFLAGALGSALGGVLPGPATSTVGLLAALGAVGTAAGYLLSRPPLGQQRQRREVAAEDG